MKRKIAILAVAVCALVPVFMVSAPSAGATHIQGCIHWNEQPGPYGAFGVDAYNRCNGVTIRRKPDIINGKDGGCKTMIPNHHYGWDLWAPVSIPFTSHVRGWIWC
jgi:hypothetical protein